MNFYSQFMTKGDIVFDVGANVGDKSAIFSSLAKTVIAIEPQQACLPNLRNRFRNSNVIVVDKALGSQRGKTSLRRSVNMTTTASMSSRFIKDVLSSGRFGERWDDFEEVEVITLNELIAAYGSPAFIKIDVEGFEPEVIRGLSKPVKALSFEFHPEVLYMAEEVLQHAKTLGPISVNYALGNNFTELELDEWVSPEDLTNELKQFVGDNSIMGDIYIQWKI